VTANGLTGAASALTSMFHQIGDNARTMVGILTRKPRSLMRWPQPWWIASGAIAAIAAVIATMIMIDGWSLVRVRSLPPSVADALNQFTDFGKGGFFLWPLGFLLVALSVSEAWSRPRIARLVVASWAVRLSFVFSAIALPSLFTTVVKRIIGRARPFVMGDDTFSYAPFAWRVEYASLPSGHTTTAFAALVALGAMFPQARALLWIYAVMIAFSRVALTSHHPSDTVAGAIVGAAGAWLVLQWFAARRLAFVVGPNGAIRPMPGPSLARIMKAVACGRLSP
jgi:membrane-associated phospholipid phosphatase